MSEAAVLKCRYFKHPTNAISGVTHVAIVPSTVKKVDQGGADATGQAASLVTKSRLMIEVYGTNFAALLALIGATAANGVAGYTDGAGALRKRTFKNAYFVEPIPPVHVPVRDETGKPVPFGVRAVCLGEAADSWTTMIVDAPD